jgi:hypothetical protein
VLRKARSAVGPGCICRHLYPLQFQGGLKLGRPVVKIVGESLSQHDKKHVVQIPLSGIGVVKRKNIRLYEEILCLFFILQCSSVWSPSTCSVLFTSSPDMSLLCTVHSPQTTIRSTSTTADAWCSFWYTAPKRSLIVMYYSSITTCIQSVHQLFAVMPTVPSPPAYSPFAIF